MAINDLITFRKGTATQWSDVNPVLASGEPGYDLTNQILKIGDGSSNWTTLTNHKHTSSDISNFNSSVSGLLNVKSLVGSTGIGIVNSGGVNTISVTGIPSSLISDLGNIATTEVIGRTGIVLSYDVVYDRMYVDVSGVSLVGHTHTSSNITDFNSSVSGLLSVTNIIAGTNITVTPSGSSYTINSTATGGGGSSPTGVRGIISTTGSVSGFVIGEGYTVGYLDLFQDGVKLVLGSDFVASDGSAVSLTNSVPSGTTLEYLTIVQTAAAQDARWIYFYPPAPIGLTGTPGNATASLSWSAGSGNIGPPITDYSIQYSANSGSSWTTFSDGTSTSTTASVTGLSNGTSYLFRAAAINGIGTGSYSSNSSSVTPITGDPYFSYISLLLHGEAMSDSSNYARVVTATSATINNSVFKYGSGSIYLAGTGNVSVPSNNIDLSGDFVIEFWIRLTNATAQQWILGGNANSSGYFMAAFNATGSGQFWIGQAAVGWPVQFSGLSLSNDTWHHVAVVRTGSSNKLYVDGSQVGSALTDSTSWVINPAGLLIGGQTAGTSLNGYVDDLRITAGSTRGYAGSTITVPTSAFPNGVGDGHDPYFAQVSLLLHMDGTGSSFVDSGPFPKSLTSNGSAVQSATQSKWGGKSLFVEDSSKYVSLSSTGIVLSGDFAMECWVYMLGWANSYVILEGRNNTSAYEDFVWYLHNGGYNGFVNAGGGGTRLDGTTAMVPQNQWCHIAISREGSTIRAYVNGVKDATTASYGSAITATSSVLKVGSNGSQGFYGYIDDFRLTNGYHRGYTGSTITVPTAAFLDY